MVDYVRPIDKRDALLKKMTAYYPQQLSILYRTKEKANKHIALMSNVVMSDGIFFYFNDEFEFLIAEGKQLDCLGEIIGSDRFTGVVIPTGGYFDFFGKINAKTFGRVGQLDIGGIFFRVSEDVFETIYLNDRMFRIFLALTITANHSNGSVEDINRLLWTYFRGKIYVSDNYDMTMNVNLTIEVSVEVASVIQYMILYGFFPKPAGVRAILVEV